MTREIIARFPGKCLCGFRFRAGTTIKWSPEGHLIEECEWCRGHKRAKAPKPVEKSLPRIACGGWQVEETWDPFAFVWRIIDCKWMQINEFLNT